jgi:hypothetical protein
MLGVVGDEVRVDAVGLHPAERGEGAGRVGGGDVGLHEGVVEVGVGLDAAVREDGEELRDLPRVSAPAHGVGEGEEGPARGPSGRRRVELVEEPARGGDGAVDGEAAKERAEAWRGSERRRSIRRRRSGAESRVDGSASAVVERSSWR